MIMTKPCMMMTSISMLQPKHNHHTKNQPITPRHPLWLLTIAEVYSRAMRLRDGGVEEITGPVVLYAAFKAYLQELGAVHINATDVHILPAGCVVLWRFVADNIPNPATARCMRTTGTTRRQRRALSAARRA